MIENRTKKSFVDQLSTLNKGMILALVLASGLVGVDAYTSQRTMQSRTETRETLTRKKSTGTLLESLFRSLDKDRGQLSEELAFARGNDGQISKAFNDDMASLAAQHGMQLDWVEDLAGEDRAKTSVPLCTVVSLSGDFEGFRAFLLDLLIRPDVSGLPLIQVISGKNRLSMMLNVERLSNERDLP
jgi:hypothetical protein